MTHLHWAEKEDETKGRDADGWERGGILSSSLRFIFSETHWGPTTRRSSAWRNAALFLFACSFFYFCFENSQLISWSSPTFIVSSSLSGLRNNHPLPPTSAPTKKWKQKPSAPSRSQTLADTKAREHLEYKWAWEQICRDAAEKLFHTRWMKTSFCDKVHLCFWKSIKHENHKKQEASYDQLFI